MTVYQRKETGDPVRAWEPMCSAEPAAVPPAEEQADDEDDERGSADLLSQDGAAWGRGWNSPAGVLE